MMRPALGLPTRATRKSGSVLWTETWSGEMCCSSMRRQSIFAQVREGDEAAIEHRVAVVVVHDIERAAHALGDLLDETERTGVFADADPVERRVGECYAPEFVALELEVIAEQHAGALDVEDDVFGLRLKLEVERVDERQSVDADDAIARLDPELHGQRCRRHRIDLPGDARGQVNAAMR